MCLVDCVCDVANLFVAECVYAVNADKFCNKVFNSLNKSFSISPCNIHNSDNYNDARDCHYYNNDDNFHYNHG